MKPIATLMKPLRSIDLTTMAESPAAIERSDVCAVPAAAVVAEAMVAFVLADALTEKFGADSVEELQTNWRAFRDRTSARFREDPERTINARARKSTQSEDRRSERQRCMTACMRRCMDADTERAHRNDHRRRASRFTANSVLDCWRSAYEACLCFELLSRDSISSGRSRCLRTRISGWTAAIESTCSSKRRRSSKSDVERERVHSPSCSRTCDSPSAKSAAVQLQRGVADERRDQACRERLSE